MNDKKVSKLDQVLTDINLAIARLVKWFLIVDGILLVIEQIYIALWHHPMFVKPFIYTGIAVICVGMIATYISDIKEARKNEKRN